MGRGAYQRSRVMHNVSSWSLLYFLCMDRFGEVNNWTIDEEEEGYEYLITI